MILNFQWSAMSFIKKTLQKKWSFPLRISSVNVTKSAKILMKKSLIENLIFCAVKIKKNCVTVILVLINVCYN